MSNEGKNRRGLDEMTFIGIRKNIGLTLGYDDNNDGFNRTALSANKYNRARTYKIGKINKKNPTRGR
jgi:hypothetical protein